MSALISEVKISVKVIGANGQISLGKEYAGRQVLVEEREPGVWFVRTALVIPENEHWLHAPVGAARLQTAVAWAASNRPRETKVDALFDGMNDVTPPARQTRKTRPQQSRISKKSA